MSDKVTIDNPITGKRETLDQAEFNRYMSQTNGDVLNWIVKDSAQASDEKPVLPAKVTLEEALQDIVIEWNN